MGIWKSIKTSNGKQRDEIDVNVLILRLKSIVKEGNIEVAQLAIESLLDELEDNK
jgi:hypothetical protein